jgi:hypothetical protein
MVAVEAKWLFYLWHTVTGCTLQILALLILLNFPFICFLISFWSFRVLFCPINLDELPTQLQYLFGHRFAHSSQTNAAHCKIELWVPQTMQCRMVNWRASVRQCSWHWLHIYLQGRSVNTKLRRVACWHWISKLCWLKLVKILWSRLPTCPTALSAAQ